MNTTCIDLSPSTSVPELPSHSHNELEQIIHHTYMIIYPIIFVVGLIGNLLSCLLFSITELNQNSCGVYFLLLAVADSIALIGGLHHCLTIGYHVPVPNAYYCRVRNFLLYTSMDMASWMIVAISVDRFFKVRYPIKARIYSTKKLTILVSSVLALVLIGKNIHLSTQFIGDFSANADDNCDANPTYPTYVSFFKNVWPWIDLVTFALLPFLLLTSCNIYIICNQYKRQLKFGHRSLDHSLTKFLLISSITFIVCNLPISVIIVIYPYVAKTYGKQEYDTISFVFDILRLLSYASLAFNFYLYYYSSSIFRQQAVLLYKRLFRITDPVQDSHRLHTQRRANPDEQTEEK